MPFQQNRSEKANATLAARPTPFISRLFPQPQNPVKGLFLGLAVGVALAVSTVPVAAAGNVGSAFLVAQKPAKAPSGFIGLCARYDWVCSATKARGNVTAEHISLAKTINRTVNRQVKEIEDLRQYGKEEHWALPSARGGDCEDLVLLKKKMLVERGVPSDALLIATVLDRKLNSHAVLVMRTKAGDLVLDNLTNKIKPWKETGYTFLKLQNPKSLNRWDAVLAGGVISDRPTASR
ncbi:Predicted transglutaminase-like cysteine proteinase [Roseobacter denitrificans OCh 114]|nr:Predicted transglutaminase-like cysteine proteinase [Roseobacter denitrificans OCh 114]